MKYCTNCGAEIADEAVVCVKCGCATGAVQSNNVGGTGSTLQIVAKVFMILGCIATAGFFLIPLCWTVPMTVKYWRDVKYNRHTGVGFKVCALLFVSLIAGVLMLCDSSEGTTNNTQL